MLRSCFRFSHTDKIKNLTLWSKRKCCVWSVGRSRMNKCELCHLGCLGGSPEWDRARFLLDYWCHFLFWWNILIFRCKAVNPLIAHGKFWIQYYALHLSTGLTGWTTSCGPHYCFFPSVFHTKCLPFKWTCQCSHCFSSRGKQDWSRNIFTNAECLYADYIIVSILMLSE